MEKSLEERISELEKNQFIQKNVLSFEEASKFLNLSKSYLYKLTSGGQVPHYKPQGKILYFDKEELENWLRQNPVRSKKELQEMASSFIAFLKEKPEIDYANGDNSRSSLLLSPLVRGKKPGS